MREPPALEPADLVRDRGALIEINEEYVAWVTDGIRRDFGIGAGDILGGTVSDYVRANLGKIAGHAPPEGIFYLVRMGGALAGMGGLRALGEGVGEVKRVYVRPAYRGHGVARQVLARLVDDARGFGLTRLVLDTAPFMVEAHALYEAAGFRDRGPYPGVEVTHEVHDRWRFMERDIAT